MHTMRKVTINAYLRSFQYKILNNILPLNKKLYTFVLSNTNLYVLLAKWQKRQKVTIVTYIQNIWNQALAYFTDCLHFSQLTPWTAVFDFHNIDNGTLLIQNHTLLLLKLHICNTRKYGFLSFSNFLNEIRKIKNLEGRIAVNNWNKCENLERNSTEQKIKYLRILSQTKQYGIVGFFSFFFIDFSH